MKILMLVANDVRNDSRVLKESEALSVAGHEVTIWGISSSFSLELWLPFKGVEVRTHRNRISPTSKRLNYLLRRISLLLTITFTLMLALALWTSISAIEFLPAILFGLVISLLLFITSRTWAARLAGVANVVSLTTRWRFLNKSQFRAIRRAHNLSDFDVIHAHDLTFASLARKLQRVSQAKLIWDAHELYWGTPGLTFVERRWNKRECRKMLNSADGMITVNDEILKEYKKVVSLSFPHRVVMNATEASKSGTYDGRLHRAANIDRSNKILLYQGGLSLDRGISFLVDAAGHLPEDWSLVLMTNGDVTKFVRGNLPQNVVSIPMVDPHVLPSWIAGATVGAIPYLNTGANHEFSSPNKLWEYCAAGVPVLANELKTIGRLVSPYDFARTVDVALGPENWAREVVDLSKISKKLLLGSKQDFFAETGWGVQAEALESLYSEI